MGKTYLVLGAGRQGTCAAYDLMKFGDADIVILGDSDFDLALEQTKRVSKLTPGIFKPIKIDVTSYDNLKDVLRNVDACLSAVPYFMSPQIAKACVETKTHFNDLGGNTQVVRNVLELSHDAKEAGISLIPDCGVAPGMANILAQREINKYDDEIQVGFMVGGLPQNRGLPLGYKLVFSPGGLSNEYDGKAITLSNYEIKEVDALSKCLPFTFNEDFQDMEYFPKLGNNYAQIVMENYYCYPDILVPSEDEYCSEVVNIFREKTPCSVKRASSMRTYWMPLAPS